MTIKNFHCFLTDYFGFNHKDIIYRIRGKNIRIKARGGSPDCKEIVIVMSGYEYPIKLLPRLNNPIIWDLGAHIGSFSLFAFDFYKSEKPKIYCFEPEQTNYSYLQDNLRLNQIPSEQYAVLNCAVGDYNGIAQLDISGKNDSHRISKNLKRNFVNCQIRTLPELANYLEVDRIDILKMDVEGSEYKIILDECSAEFLSEHVSYILLEYHNTKDNKGSSAIKEKMCCSFDVLHERNEIIFFKNKQMNID